MIPTDKKLVLFDGVCNLCNHAVQFIIKHDRKDHFRFTALQSEIGKQLIGERGIDTSTTDSVILIIPHIAYYVKSSAILQIAYDFGGVWKILKILEWIPVKWRDYMYSHVAKNRYRWFGKKEHCMLPTPELKAKFLTHP